MAYEIRIVGENNPITLDNNLGLQVKVAYDDDSIPDSQKLRIGDTLSVRKSQIRFVRRVEDSEAANESKNRVADDINGDHLKRYRIIRNLRPEEKARQVELFRQCHKAVSGSFPSESSLEGFRKDSIAFFTDNPNRIVPSPSCFRNNMPKEGGNPFASRFMLRLLESVIMEDMITAKKS